MTSAAVDSPKGLPGRIVRKTAVEWVLDDLRQRIEQADMRFGLRLGRGIGGPRRTQVAKARQRNHARTLLHQWPRPDRGQGC